MLVDTHAHLNASDFADDLAATVDRSVEAGVGIVICVGYDVESSRRAVELAAEHPRIFATVGVHPNYVAAADASWKNGIRELAKRPRVVGLGETGLDYYREFTGVDEQIQAFEWHCALAAELSLPLVVHDRDAHRDVAGYLRAWMRGRPPTAPAGVLHSFCADDQMLQDGLDLGFAISFSGMVTFTNRSLAHLAGLVRSVPDEALLLETDSPYLAPAPHRGRRNEPAFTRAVGERVAELRGTTLGDLARLTTANACRVFPGVSGVHVA